MVVTHPTTHWHLHMYIRALLWCRPRCSEIIDHIESLILKLDEYEGKHEPVRVHQGSPRALSQSRVLESVRNVTSKTFAKLTGKP